MMSTNGITMDTVASKTPELLEEKLEIVIATSHDQPAELHVNVQKNSSISVGQCGSVQGKKIESSTSEEMTVQSSTPSSNIIKDEETKIRHLQLYRAALNGDWNMAEDIFKDHPDDINAAISKKENTILHIAASAESPMFVKNLVEKMNGDDLAKKNNDENTAFCLAAASGKVELAKEMMKKNVNLVKIRGSRQMLPLYMAALFGHQEMVNYLYKATGDKVLNDKDRINLLVTLIDTGLYDIALDLVEKHPDLATARDGNYETALHALARMPVMSSNLKNINQQGVLKECYNLFSGTNTFHHKKLPPQALELIAHLWRKVVVLDDSKISEIIGIPWRLIFVAAEQGNIEFLTIFIREYPDLILKVDDNRYSIFHFAVLYRHNDVFKLIHEVGSIKDLIVPYKDKDKNNILHLAGLLAPPDRLNIVSGAALQLQRELLWFEEVRKIVHPLDVEYRNKEKKTPRELFTEKHAKLKEKGEEWMKDTANYCMIVATLIATVVFAAAFTVPGGTKDETGTPHFIQKISFKTFLISDAISLVSSCCSILNFLSILTSRYAEEDFLFVLPRKLVIGLATLFLSIAAMMVVFCATIFIVFKDGELWLPILVTVIASVPAILFTKQQLHLFFDVARSTYKSSSLFQSSKQTLFHRKEDKVKESKKEK